MLLAAAADETYPKLLELCTPRAPSLMRCFMIVT